MTRSVVIIGAGIVGAACAFALSRDGWKITLIESDAVGSGATAAGMGHLVVMDDSAAQLALTKYSRDLWIKLFDHLPASAEVLKSGTLWAAADAEEMAEVHKKHAICGANGIRSEILDSRQLRRAEPNLRPGLAGALLVPDDAVVFPPVVARWLIEKSGAQVVYNAAVARISGREVVFRDGSTWNCDHVVVANGAKSVNLVPGIPIKPRKGHLAITDRYPGFVNHQIVELGYLKSAHGSTGDSVAFNAQPRSTGQILIGSSRQFGDESSNIRPEMLRKMLQRAFEYMPGLAQLNIIRTWTGFRAATPDKIPLIGPTSADENLILATGHEGLGITTSLATGEMVADLLAQRESAIDRTPFDPRRFGDRDGEFH